MDPNANTNTLVWRFDIPKVVTPIYQYEDTCEPVVALIYDENVANPQNIGDIH